MHALTIFGAWCHEISNQSAVCLYMFVTNTGLLVVTVYKEVVNVINAKLMLNFLELISLEVHIIYVARKMQRFLDETFSRLL